MVQRYLAVPDLRTARFCLLLYALGMMAVKGLSVATGLLLYATYEGCDPISAKVIKIKTPKLKICKDSHFVEGVQTGSTDAPVRPGDSRAHSRSQWTLRSWRL
jgi:hypothetical protein